MEENKENAVSLERVKIRLLAAILAGVLLAVGYLLYHEALTWNKVLGVVICLVGLVFINLK